MNTLKSCGRSYLLRPVLTFSDLERLYRTRRNGNVPSYSGSTSLDQSGHWGRNEWDGGVRSVKQVLDALSQGWDAGNLTVAAGLDALDLDTSESGGWDLDVAGSYCSVPDYLTGTPDCMMRKDAGQAARRVRLVVFCYMTAGIPADAGIRYARAQAAYSALMMARGYDVAITVIGAVTSRNVGCTVLKPVRVKEYGHEPDASRIAFAAHPAFLRRVMFCAMEWDEDVPRDCRQVGYGGPPYWADEVAVRAALGPETDGERMIILPALESLNYRADWQSMFQELIAQTADQHEERGDGRL